MSTEYKLAVVGSESSIMVYKALGVDTYGADETPDPSGLVYSLANKTTDDGATPLYAIVFVEEATYKLLSDDVIARLAKRALPALIPVPSLQSGADGKSFAAERQAKLVERAIGSNILG